MKTIIILLLLSGLCFAEEFTKDKFDAEGLVKEIENATGLDLTGQEQVGYMSTNGNKIEIILKDRELTQVEKDKIAEVITNHNIVKIKQDEEIEEKAKKEAIKTKLGLTEQDLKDLKEVLSD